MKNGFILIFSNRATKLGFNKYKINIFLDGQKKIVEKEFNNRAEFRIWKDLNGYDFKIDRMEYHLLSGNNPGRYCLIDFTL